MLVSLQKGRPEDQKERVQWSMLRRLGHKDELASFEDGAGEYYSYRRIMRVGEKDVSRYLPAWGG